MQIQSKQDHQSMTNQRQFITRKTHTNEQDCEHFFCTEMYIVANTEERAARVEGRREGQQRLDNFFLMRARTFFFFFFFFFFRAKKQNKNKNKKKPTSLPQQQKKWAAGLVPIPLAGIETATYHQSGRCGTAANNQPIHPERQSNSNNNNNKIQQQSREWHSAGRATRDSKKNNPERVPDDPRIRRAAPSPPSSKQAS
jgi:hypothetical protein